MHITSDISVVFVLREWIQSNISRSRAPSTVTFGSSDRVTVMQRFPTERTHG